MTITKNEIKQMVESKNKVIKRIAFIFDTIETVEKSLFKEINAAILGFDEKSFQSLFFSLERLFVSANIPKEHEYEYFGTHWSNKRHFNENAFVIVYDYEENDGELINIPYELFEMDESVLEKTIQNIIQKRNQHMIQSIKEMNDVNLLKVNVYREEIKNTETYLCDYFYGEKIDIDNELIKESL